MGEGAIGASIPCTLMLRRFVLVALLPGLLQPVGSVGQELSPLEWEGREKTQKVIVSFPAFPDLKSEELIRSYGGILRYTYHLLPAIAASVPVSRVDSLRRDPGISLVEDDGIVTALDTELDQAWGVRRVRAGKVHEGGIRGKGVKVAVIDTGVDYTHPELRGNYAGGYDFVNGDSDPMDDHGHGTHVAGTIAARDDEVGVVGAAPEASIIALKVLSRSGQGNWSDIIAALEWASDNGIQVTNNSYGTTVDPGVAVRLAFTNSDAQGILHVAAAGNAGDCLGQGETMTYPARYEVVIAVAATDRSDKRACFSSTGIDLDLAAPGAPITSTLRGGGYGEMSGTSMASPHVAGVAALVLSKGVTDRSGNGRVNDEVRSILLASAEDLGAPGKDTHYGAGMVDAHAAVKAEPPSPKPLVPSVLPKEVGASTRVRASVRARISGVEAGATAEAGASGKLRRQSEQPPSSPSPRAKIRAQLQAEFRLKLKACKALPPTEVGKCVSGARAELRASFKAKLQAR